jgi:hypothetical protein
MSEPKKVFSGSKAISLSSLCSTDSISSEPSSKEGGSFNGIGGGSAGEGIDTIVEEISTSKVEQFLENFKSFYINLNEPSAIINNPESIEYIDNLFTHIRYLAKRQRQTNQLNNVLDILADSKLIKKFCSVLNHCFNFLYSLVSAYELSIDPNGCENFHKIYSFLSLLVQLVWCLTNFSAKFRREFHAQMGTRILLNYLEDEQLVNNCILFTNEARLFDYYDENFSLKEAIVGSLHNLIKTIQFESDLNATSILISFMHQMKETNKNHNSSNSEKKLNFISVYLILAHILTDKEIDHLPDIIEIVDKLVRIISQAAEQIENSTSCKRLKVTVDNDRIEYVCTVKDECAIWDLIELINGLYRIAVNDKIKYYIYINCNFKDIVYKILKHGNTTEKEYAIKILYQLSFDENLRALIIEDENLTNVIKEISNENQNNPESSHLVSNCNGLNWILDNGLYARNNEDKLFDKRNSLCVPEEKKMQIMISYNKDNRDLVMNIKRILESLNFKIWIDVEHIHGSSLEVRVHLFLNTYFFLNREF